MMGSSVSQPNLFSLLPETRKPWTEVAFSFGIQGVAVALLIWVRLLHPEILQDPVRDYHAIELVPTPVPENHRPQPVRHFTVQPVEVAKLDPPPVAALKLPAPQPKPKVKVEDTPAPQVAVADTKLENLPPAPKTIIPRPPVRTNVFSSGSSATPTVALAAQRVQTGGFGDPNGVPAKASQGKPITIAQLGSFDLPTGPGMGNGTGGASGVRGVTVSSGFGSGVAVNDSRPVTRAAVHTGGFGDADVAAPPTTSSRTPQAAAKVLPAEILWKPTPVYTSEARKLKVEGEVLVEAVLEASGTVKVLRVVRGLGHGLDEEAVREAGQLRFKPALRDGQPSDSTVVLHVVFQIA